jgi:hypothetical protein
LPALNCGPFASLARFLIARFHGSPSAGDHIYCLNAERKEYYIEALIHSREVNMSTERDQYVAKLKVKLDEWNAGIDLLEVKANQAVGRAQDEFRKQIDSLKAQRQEVESNLKKLQGAGGEAWQDLKTGVESAWQALGKAVRSAGQRLDEVNRPEDKKE